jgi:hypothetical protein
MVNFRFKLSSSEACVLAIIAILTSNASAYGSSTEDLSGAFSIQKTIKIGGSSECFDGANSDKSANDLTADPLDPPGIAQPADNQPPRLAALSIEAKTAKSRASIQSINLTARIIDDKSGLSSGNKANLSIAHFQSPSGKQSADAIFHPDNITYGNELDGIYSMNIVLPPDSEPGIWWLNNFMLIDGQGNCRILRRDDLAGLGFPVQFLVT